MVKRNVTLNLTDEFIRELKSQGVNISSAVDEYLAQRVSALREPKSTQGGQPKSPQTKLEEAQARKIERQHEAKERRLREAKLVPLRDFYIERCQGSEDVPKWSEIKRKRWLVHTANELGVTIEELLKLLELKKEE